MSAVLCRSPAWAHMDRTLASGQAGGEWPRKRQTDKEAGIPGAAEGPSRRRRSMEESE